MESFITDFLKVYNNLVDAYNAKILETINDKYRIIDRAMIASYLYIKMLDKLNLRSPKTDASLINYLMKDYEQDPNSIWQSEIFGRSLEAIVQEGIQAKLSMMPDATRYKLSQTVTKIVNKGANNLIAIVL